MSIARINGFADMFEPESTAFTFMESQCRAIFPAYGFKEVRLPVLEYTDLFARSIGTETDVVQKEMYTFPDSKGKPTSLRPEATAGMMRAYIAASLHAREQVSRLYTFGPMFRHERPQKGRMRQFHQIDCELLRSSSPVADADVVSLLVHFVSSLGIGGLTLRMNSLGCASCRQTYRQALISHFEKYEADLCEDCRRRLHANPLRVLDCKKDRDLPCMLDAPRLLDYNCPDCLGHYETVTGLLKDAGIAFVQDDRLVRGLDYYCRTTFELQSDAIGAQTAVAGGGRYDGLVKQLGGPDIPGIGFACGMERLALLLGERQLQRHDFFVVSLDPSCTAFAFKLAQNLRHAGLSGETGYGSSGMKSAMRQAGKSGARFAVIVGTDELSRGACAVKNMDQGTQEEVPADALATYIANKD
ncbi:MAG: histidine--tRNA ligase [Desulfovibrio sp.]|nr:histidine--tRNA ligase [Desulfovibrio sp.]